MVRLTQEEIDAQLARQELDSDGSESASGSNPVSGEDTTADVDNMMEEVIGNDPKEESDGEGFNIGLAVNADEINIQKKPIDGYTADDDELEDEEGELDDIERKETVTEDAASDNSFETFGEDDDLDDTSEE